MGLEQNLWIWFKDGLKTVEGLKLQRVENNVAKGFPDIVGHYKKTGFFIETKACRQPAKRDSLLKFEIYKEQIIWNRDWWLAGARCYFLIRVGKEREMYHYLIPGNMGSLLERCKEYELKAISVIPFERPDQKMILRKIISYQP